MDEPMPGWLFLLVGFLAAGIAGLLVGWIQRRLGFIRLKLSLGHIAGHVLGLLVTTLIWFLILVMRSPAPLRPEMLPSELTMLLIISVIPWFTAGFGVWALAGGKPQDKA